ncbi:APC family permease [Streptococcus cameli]
MEKEQFEQNRVGYGLGTTIAMIVGIVIGSGIYFKADDILSFAGGSVLLGMAIIMLGSFAIVFGSLSLSELALRHSDSGGIFHYYAHYIHPGLATALGLFTAYIYLPTVIAVVVWVAAAYTLGSQSTLEAQVSLAAIYLLVLTILNIFSKVLAGRFQSLSTVIKVVPLVIIACVGIFGQNTQEAVLTSIPNDIGVSWLSGLVPLYFAYDGWTIVASIAPEIKQPRKNLPLAFLVGPLLILSLYLAFFYGLNAILGPSVILKAGNDAVPMAMQLLYGKTASRLLLVVIIISVLGVSNGMLLGAMRLPQAFAERGWIKNQSFSQIHLKYQLSIPASVSVAVVTLFWLFIHYLAMKFQLLPGSDISEITIVFNNISFIILYVIVLRLCLKGEITNRITGLIAPVFAILSALILLVGALLTNLQMVSLFFGFCLVFCLLAYLFNRKTSK